MESFVNLFTSTGNLHHAYLFEGDEEATRAELLNFIETKLGQSTKGNPDVWQEKFEILTIDDARGLRERQANRAFSDGRKIFIITTRFATLEAQNSLLKILEEPTPNTHFFILSPNAQVFLPTVRSRLMIIKGPTGGNTFNEGADTQSDIVRQFILATIPERLKFVADIIEEKDKTRAGAFVDALMKVLHKKTQVVAPNSKFFDSDHIFEELLRSRAYLNDRSPSVKLILEHLSVTIPRIQSV